MAYENRLKELENHENYNILSEIFANSKDWVDKETGESISIYPMSSYGYGSRGPGSITVTYLDQSKLAEANGANGTRILPTAWIRSFRPKEFLETFEVSANHNR